MSPDSQPNNASTNGDQKVTNAVISGQIKRLDEKLAEYIERADKRLEKIEDCQKVDHDEITRIKTKYDLWSGLNSALSVLAGAFGSIVK